MKLDLGWSDDLETYSFPKVFFIWSIVLGFHFCLYNKESSLSLYILFGVSCFIVSTLFLNDIVVSLKKRKIYSVFVSVFATIGYSTYTVLSTPVTLLSQTYLLLCLFFALLLSPPKIFPVFIILGYLFGSIVFVLDKNKILFDWNRVIILGVDSILIILIWGFLYRQRHLAMDEKKEKLKEMAVSLNHELSSYLAGLRLYVSFFRKTPKYQNDYPKIEMIELSLSRMALFIETLQGNFRDHFPKGDLQLFTIKASVENAINACSIEENIKKSLIISGDDFPIVVDEVVFKHVLYNLLCNATHFIKKARKGHITIDFSHHETFNQMIFEDTGYGIKEDHLPYIFNKFFSRRRHGTGMGLYFCQTALEAYGATISCESKFGYYTRFTLCFPIKLNL